MVDQLPKSSHVVLGLLLILAGVTSPHLYADELKAGAAKIDITPPIGFPMWGYAARRDRPSVGVLDPLYARCLYLRAGGKDLALVSLDLGRAPTRKSMRAIRAALKPSGIEHVFMVGTHTHHGPVIELDDWPNPASSYVRELEHKVVKVILEARARVTSARLGVAHRQLPFNRNRHSRLPDKVVDRDFVVVRVEDLSGRALAHLVNFAAHPTMLDRDLMKFSADYPGFLAKAVESRTSAPCLFLQGAAGDLSTNPGSLRGPGEFGSKLGAEALQLSGRVEWLASANPSLQIAEESFTFGNRVDLQNPLIRRAFAAAFFARLVDFYEEEYRQGVRPCISVALFNDELGIVGVSGELFCGHALHLKRRARLKHLIVLGYCNDYQQYLPTIEAAAEGGYGAAAGVSTAEIGAGERMMDRALTLLYQMRGKYPELNLGRK